MHQIFKVVDTLFFSLFSILLSAAIFMRYSQDVELSKALVQGGLFQYLLPVLLVVFAFKIIYSIILLQTDYQKTDKGAFFLSLLRIIAEVALVFFFIFLLTNAEVSSHINIQSLFILQAILSCAYLMIKSTFLQRASAHAHYTGAHNG